jgi:hypothetical protein
MKVHYLQT